MAWMTKNLALDLLAILIDAGQSAFDRIKQEPEGDWPPADTQPEPSPAPVTPQPEQEQQTAPAPQEPDEAAAPCADPQALLIEAKNLLQPISQGGGRDWIKNTLLPAFNVDKLSDVPADELPELINKVKQYQKEGQ